MKILTCLILLTVGLAYGEQTDLLQGLPAEFLANLVEQDTKMLASESKDEESISPFKQTPVQPQTIKKPLPTLGISSLSGAGPIPGHGKFLKVAAPLKKVAAKKVVSFKLKAPVLKVAKGKMALKAKPKVHSLKPIIHVIEKPVAVYHKVPVPKKVIVPKFYPVFKPIPVPKFVPVPFKVPVKKIVPKIVKIPKPIPIPKFVPVKKPIPIGIPYPVPKFHKVPIPKPVPYAKFIPIPIPKKVPKFIPVPVKKIIKVPKPYYVPVKVPHITASYMKTPMIVNVPDVKKIRPGKFGGKKPMMNFIRGGNEENVFKFMDKDTVKESEKTGGGNLGTEDQELLKMLTGVASGIKL